MVVFRGGSHGPSLKRAMFRRVAASSQPVGPGCPRGVVHPFPTAPFIIGDRRRGQGVDNPAKGGGINAQPDARPAFE